MKEDGWRVKQQIPTPSGVLDMSAEKEGAIMLIEATGEDKGGDASAEMTFQIELGQLMSRMIRRETQYALAFPLTATFIKVLQKYRGTFAFTNLGICLIPVSRDGTCQIISPMHIAKFLDMTSKP
ncbi:MAG: hypothetical protein JSV05_01235 [Candidatus Bathyarchaeota archaeon]|nr:MAG: hypothetical protein JSV05_01235 [Candidatus Bathyarchaeota archaeon]